MTAATWLAALVLGPGALGLFVWFLRDLRELLGDEPGMPDPREGSNGETDVP